MMWALYDIVLIGYHRYEDKGPLSSTCRYCNSDRIKLQYINRSTYLNSPLSTLIKFRVPSSKTKRLPIATNWKSSVIINWFYYNAHDNLVYYWTLTLLRLATLIILPTVNNSRWVHTLLSMIAQKEKIFYNIVCRFLPLNQLFS